MKENHRFRLRLGFQKDSIHCAAETNNAALRVSGSCVASPYSLCDAIVVPNEVVIMHGARRAPQAMIAEVRK